MKQPSLVARASWFLMIMMVCLLMWGCTGEEQDAPLADGQYLVVISEVDLETDTITVDEIEWISVADSERIAQLGLDREEDFSNDFYIYNAEEVWLEISLSEYIEVEIISWGTDIQPRTATKEELSDRIDEYSPPFHMTVSGGEIEKLQEQYVP